MNPTQTSLLAAFHAADDEYVIVGGVAVNLHGHTRATTDLDLFIRPTIENARIVWDVLNAIGVTFEGLDFTDLLDDEQHVRFGTEDLHVDILTSIGEMPFDQVWRNRVETEFEGVFIIFISKDDLIQNKLQTGRHRDLGDVEELNRKTPIS